MSGELERIGLLNGLKGDSMRKAVEHDRKEGLSDRAIHEKYYLAVIEYLGGKRGIRIKDGRVVFAAIGSE